MKRGATVWVEYTIVPYMGKKPMKDDNGKFDPGCTLQPLLIDMLNGTVEDDDSHYDFGWLKKRKRTVSSD